MEQDYEALGKVGVALQSGITAYTAESCFNSFVSFNKCQVWQGYVKGGLLVERTASRECHL